MRIVKLIGKKYDAEKLEENSKIVRKWLVIKQINKEELTRKYYDIEDCDKISKVYEETISKIDPETRSFYAKYIEENWRETHPIMKDVSAYAKIRPEDGTEFCILI